MSPSELMNDGFTKENLLQLVHIRDQGPMLLFRTPYYADPDFQEQIAAYESDASVELLPAPDDAGVPLPDSMIDAREPLPIKKASEGDVSDD